MDTRLIRIEEKIAHAEHFVGELDDVVRALQKEVKQLRTKVAQLEGRLGAHLADPDAPRTLEDDKPPHY